MRMKETMQEQLIVQPEVAVTRKEIAGIMRKTKKLKNENFLGYAFIMPFLIVFLTFSIYPIIKTLMLSFTDYAGYGEPIFNGLSNYQQLLSDPMFYNAFGNTIKMWGINIVLQMGLAFALMLIFSDIKYKMKGLKVYRAIFYLPNLIAATSVAFLFSSLLDWQYGSFNQMLMSAGLIDTKINWLGQPGTAIIVVGVIGAWMWFGSTFIVLMAGVQGISKEYFEAAHIDGANRWQVFTKITLPLLKPILLYVALTSFIGGIQMFDIPFLLTDGIGAPFGALNTVVMYLFNTAFKYNNVGYAAAIAYGLFFVIAISSVFIFKTMYRTNVKKKGEK